MNSVELTRQPLQEQRVMLKGDNGKPSQTYETAREGYPLRQQRVTLQT